MMYLKRPGCLHQKQRKAMETRDRGLTSMEEELKGKESKVFGIDT